MKIMISLLSFVIVFFGFMHFFNGFFLPTKGDGYSISLVILGIIVIAMSIINKLLLGLERFFLIIQGILLICVGLLVFFPAMLPLVPREGIAYAGIVLAIGAAGLAYGLMGAA